MPKKKKECGGENEKNKVWMVFKVGYAVFYKHIENIINMEKKVIQKGKTRHADVH